MNEFLISCDWLQIHCKHAENFLTREQPYFIFKRTGRSQVWANIYEIKDNSTGRVVGNYCTDAQLCIMPANEGVLKIENWYLYFLSNDLKAGIYTLLSKLNFTFKNITRCDIAFDFQKLHGNKSPEQFVNGIVSRKYLRAIPGKFAIFGEQKSTDFRFQTMQFGSRRSNLTMKIYNKSEELKNNSKPHIINAHNHTFVNQKGEPIKGDVWRIEFSILSLTKYFKEVNEHKEIDKKIDVKTLQVLDIDVMYGLFQGLFEKYFDFRKRDRKFKKKMHKDQRLARMEKVTAWIFDLDILKLKCGRSGIKKLPETVRDSGRSEMIFIKKLDWTAGLVEHHDTGMRFDINNIISKSISIFNLHNWADRKEYKYEKMNYANDILEAAVIDFDNKLLEKKYQTAIRETAFWEKTHHYLL